MAEAASTWTQRSYLDFNKGTLNNTTIIGSGDSAKLKINLVEMNKWTNATPINSPTRPYNGIDLRYR